MLTGQAKKDYQRKYMKDYMSRRRHTFVKTQDDLVKTQVKTSVKTQTERVHEATKSLGLGVPVMVAEPMSASERNQAVREDMSRLTIAECQAKYKTVPGWRKEQG